MQRDTAAQLAYCGIYCPVCSFRVACETGDRAHLLGMPAKYDPFKEGDLADCRCEGCKQDASCGPCAIKDCAQDRDLAHCGDCGDFPCEVLLAFQHDGIPHHFEAVQNLHQIRDGGIDRWLAEAARRAVCNVCGGRRSFYHRCRHG
ncbi:MAG: DUF3795 domain-containing protein [Clostridiales bacterium]|nr:DUF3795 domain-containing protein [Clostridiales bacterium]